MRQFVNSLCLLSLGLNVLSHPALADSASEQTTPEVHVFPTSDGEEIVSRMTDAEVSFHAMLPGLTVDTELSGILANLTGGTMCCPNRIEADVIAEKLSDAISIAPEFVGNLT